MQVHAFVEPVWNIVKKVDIITSKVHVEIYVYTFLRNANDFGQPNPPVLATCAKVY